MLIFAFSLLSAIMVDKDVDIHSLLLLHTAFLCSQLEISAICFGASAFIRGNGLGIGLGIALAGILLAFRKYSEKDLK